MKNDLVSFEKYLRENGYQEKAIDCVCPHCITASEFALQHPTGNYVLICQDAAILLKNGCYVDLKGIGDDIVLYYFKKEN